MAVENWGLMVIPKRVAERAATRFVASGDCHVSTYSVASHGYAQIGWQTGSVRYGTTAHRAAWVHGSGEQIPAGWTVDHLCHNRQCVRFEHLRSLPNLENARRNMRGLDWPIGQCVNGHGPEWWRPRSETRKKGYCHACRMEWQQKSRGTVIGRVYSRVAPLYGVV